MEIQLKSAREMFEELGYRYIKKYSDEEHLCYRKRVKKQLSIEILFYLKDKFISNDCAISLEEIKAINKQIEELGWDK